MKIRLRSNLIYLASKSPRRHELLRKLGLKFKILNPKITEQLSEKNPQRFAIKIAQEKVCSVENKIRRGIIIGVDTVVTINNRILGKPQNRKQARTMLRLLSGKTHRVISGICLIRKPDNFMITGAETTKVKFRKLNKMEIENYLKTKEPYDKAGAYGIQGYAGFFVEKVNGCYFNVIGLPITKLLKYLEQMLN